MDDPPQGNNQQRMTFGEHLEELRRRLVGALIGLALASTITLPFGRRIVAWLCVPLLDAQRAAGITPGTYVFSPLTGFTVYLKVALLSALVLAFPWIIYQAWRFLSHGLYDHERRAVGLVAPLSAALTALGVVFLYYAMLPICLWFLLSFAVSYPTVDDLRPTPSNTHASSIDAPATPALQPMPLRVPVVRKDPSPPADGQLWFDTAAAALKIHVGGATRTVALSSGPLVRPMLEVGQYLHFAVVLGVGVVTGFQLPVVMLILAWAGIVGAADLRRYRKHCVLGCFAAGALLTPADILSMFVLSFPLWVLFECGLLLMGVAERPGVNQAPPT